VEVVHLPPVPPHLEPEEGPAELRHHDPRHPVHHPHHGGHDEAHPPQPHEQEVLLVEEVVGEDAQVVVDVLPPCPGSYGDVAGHFSREQLAHGVVSHLAIGLVALQEIQHFNAVRPELVDEEHVAHEHVQENHAQVESLDEGEMEAVDVEPFPEVHEVLRDDCGLCTGLPQDVVHEAALKEAFPDDTRQLGETDGEGEEEGEPEVVGGHTRVPLLALNSALVHKAASGFSLEVLLHIPCTVDPAVRLCVLVCIPAHDGSSIQVVLQEDEHESEHEHGRGVLVVKAEQEVVDIVLVSSEPGKEVLKHGQLPESHRRRHFHDLCF